MASKVNELVKQASRMELTPEDHALQQLTREQILSCSPEERLRWFHLRPVGHGELLRVADDVAQLMEECNDVSIISLIGLSGVGKTTAAKMITNELYDRYSTEIETGATPVLYVEAPANGEKSLSWRVLYQRILHAGGSLQCLQCAGHASSMGA
jgi:ABC-type glutathione transport system ATPase component